MIKNVTLAVLIFIVCLFTYNNYKHQMTKRAFRKANINEHLILLHKGGDEKLPASNIPRGSETMFGIVIAELAPNKYALAYGEIYNITFLSNKEMEPDIKYYKTGAEVSKELFKLQREADTIVKIKKEIAEIKNKK